jgi:DNA-binding IclR family transcriptional regulator
MNNSSGVGVLDKAISVLAAAESGPASLAQLVAATGLARPTTHRIAVALEHHRLLGRDVQGRFILGPRIAELASAAGEDRLLAIAQPLLIQLRDTTGESAQLYRRQADVRVCVAAAERASGLRDTVPVGAALPMTAGSAAQILLAWEEGERMHRGLRGAKFTATTLASVRRRGWASSAAERELGVASVSAPVRGAGGRVLAAISVSGPIERLTRSPGRLHAAAVVAAGEKISDLLRAEAGGAKLPGRCPPRQPPSHCHLSSLARFFRLVSTASVWCQWRSRQGGRIGFPQVFAPGVLGAHGAG